MSHNRFYYALGKLTCASFTLALVGLVSSPASAQDEEGAGQASADVESEAAGEGEEAEEIVVTGSRIARSSLSSYGNIEVIDAEQFAKTGALTVDDLLRRLPSITLQGINANQNNGGRGFRTIELRNLGSERTLVLVNGRRYIQQGTVFNSSFVDVNDIPVQLIDRVEILFDGASAIYGSDAVAGVINFVLKDEFEGLEAEAQSGVSSRGDGEQVAVTLTGGASNARGNIVLSMNYTGIQQVNQTDRNWGKEAFLAAFPNNGDNDADGITGLYGSSSPPETRVGGDFFRPTRSNSGLTDDDLSYQPFRSIGPDQRYNFGQEQWLFGKQDRFMIHGLGKYELIDPTPNFTVEAYMEANFAHRTNTTQLAPQPLFGEVSVPLSNPNVPADYAATLAPGTTSVSINRRMVDVGNRIFELNSFSFRQLFGLRGEFLENFTYDLFGQYVLNRNWENIYNSIDVEQGNEGAGSANWFGAGNISAQDAADMRFIDVTESNDQMVNFVASLGWSQFSLPTTKKEIAVAAGYEYRDQSGLNRPGSITQRGDSAGNASTETGGSYDAHELYAELLVPLVSDIPLIHDLGVDGAIRYSTFSRSGDQVTGRVRGRYAPIPDLAFRGTFSTAFRVPNVGELFGGETESFEVLRDPCDGLGVGGPSLDSVEGQNCLSEGVPEGFQQETTQISTNIGGNPDLEAETSESFNAGVVLTTTKILPPILGRLSATFDYYVYNVDNAIDTPSGQVALNQCYASPNLSSPFCDLITRGDGTGNITDFQLTQQNIGGFFTNGIDFGVNYTYELAQVGLESLGQVDASFRGNHLIQFENTPFPDATADEIQNLEGTGSSSAGPYPALTWRLQVAWQVSKLTAAAFFTYIDSMRVLGTTDDDLFNELGEVTYTDLSLTWTEDRWQLTGGINNVTDESPPFLLGGFSNSLPEAYDFYGRYFFIRGKYTF